MVEVNWSKEVDNPAFRNVKAPTPQDACRNDYSFGYTFISTVGKHGSGKSQFAREVVHSIHQTRLSKWQRFKLTLRRLYHRILSRLG